MAPFRGRGGSRGGSRGGPRGGSRGGPRGGSRGGFRGRGDFGGRGRGRGRGGRNAAAGVKRGFPTAKLEENNLEDGDDIPSYPSDVESDAASEESLSDDEAQPVSNAYQTLLASLQSVNRSEAPQRKRQKTSHAPSGDVANSKGLSTADGEHLLIGDEVSETEEASDVDPEEFNEPPQDGEQDDVDSDEEAQEGNDGNDFFKLHFADPEENELSQRLKAISQNQWSTERLENKAGGRCLLQVPGINEKASKRVKIPSAMDINLKQRLAEGGNRVLGNLSDLEQALAPSIFGYQDVLFGGRTVQNAGRLRHMFCLHALNHIFKTRDRILKNNTKLAQASDDTDIECRDQGFTRPKVLFLLETKQACVRALDSMSQLYQFEQQENKKRFSDAFSLPEDKFSKDRPEDYRELFEGNDENEFRIGLKFTRKSLKLFAKFYGSDIIFASPLGLRRAIESGDPKKKKDYDFLSSIEIVIMEDAAAALMQNWDHTEYVFEHLNLQPTDAHDCDFSRVRPWYLENNATNLRQTLIFSSYLTPKLNTLYNNHMRNVEGRIKFTPDYTSGAIESLPLSVKQTFSRFESTTHITDPDARFKHFSNSVLPLLSRLPKPVTGGVGVLIFIPSYLDFVRVRNSLVDSDFSYASISEYTDKTDMRKARSHFASGRHSLLLYSGRAHHFHRFNLRGVKRVVFYGVPENPKFYEEVIGFIGASMERGEATKAETSSRMIFSKWERMELERIVGTKRVGKMVTDKGDTFDFV